MKHLAHHLLSGHRPQPRPKDDRSASTSLDDSEFGSVTIRRDARAKHVRLRMLPDGTLSITLPKYAAISNARKILDNSRPEIRKWRSKHQSEQVDFADGQKIGHSHTLRVHANTITKPYAKIQLLNIHLHLPTNLSIDSAASRSVLMPEIKKALTKEAKSYLPRRLRYLADQFGFSYAKTRFGTPKGRWGSCSSTGTISLNVSLMNLENELIDYVLIHELCHTKQMNHSSEFWSLVEQCLPNYKNLRRQLKNTRPLV